MSLRVWISSTGAVALLLAASAGAQDIEITPSGAMVSASSNDGNVPANAVDNNLATRWSGFGDGQWLTLDLGTAQAMSYVKIAWYQGNTRRSVFDLQTSNDQASWAPLLTGVQSNGTTTSEETFTFGTVTARYLRYLGHGNLHTDVAKRPWNSVTEISVFRAAGTPPTPTPEPATPTPVATPTPTPTPIVGTEVEITPAGAAVTASTSDGNLPANAVDNNIATRWSANGDGHWLRFDLGTVRTLTRVTVAAYSGTTRGNKFDVQVADALGGPWTTILANAVTSTDTEVSFDVPDRATRYVRYLGHGNTSTDPTKAGWNSVTEMSLYGVDCPGCVTPTPTPTPTGAPRPTPTPTPTTPPGTFPAKTFAPYIETWNNRSLVDIANAAQHKYYTLAFIINQGTGCNPSWNGDTALGSYYMNHINGLRQLGGDVIVSFGGAAGDEIGIRCTTVASLQAAYQRVIDTYNLKWLDLDIEGNEMSNTASIDRRNKAIAGLQAANPGLRISYTLAVDRTGLPAGQVNLLRNAMTNGARVDVVNIMAMDYGPCYSDMGQAAVDAAVATRNQLAQIGMNAKVGVTPMINVNDVTCEVFRTTDSTVLLNHAQANSYISHIAFWSLDRDIPASYAHTRILRNFR